VAVFFITGRREAVRQPTTENLQAQGFSGWDGLTLKPDASTQTTVTYKSGDRAAGLPHHRQRRRPVLRPGKLPNPESAQIRCESCFRRSGWRTGRRGWSI
jgi:hypothetical protein